MCQLTLKQFHMNLINHCTDKVLVSHTESGLSGIWSNYKQLRWGLEIVLNSGTHTWHSHTCDTFYNSFKNVLVTVMQIQHHSIWWTNKLLSAVVCATPFIPQRLYRLMYWISRHGNNISDIVVAWSWFSGSCVSPRNASMCKMSLYCLVSESNVVTWTCVTVLQLSIVSSNNRTNIFWIFTNTLHFLQQ